MLICVRLIQRCVKQTALVRQDMSRTYLAHHELERKLIVIIMIFINYNMLCLHTNYAKAQS